MNAYTQREVRPILILIELILDESEQYQRRNEIKMTRVRKWRSCSMLIIYYLNLAVVIINITSMFIVSQRRDNKH